MVDRSALILYILIACLFRAGGQQPGADFIHAHVTIEPDPVSESIRGEVRYRISAGTQTDSIYLDAHAMDFHAVHLNGKEVVYKIYSGKIVIPWPESAVESELVVRYTAHPSQAVYFIGWKDTIEGNEQIWTQGQGKDSSHWVPVVDDMGEKVEFDLSILFDEDFTVVAGGELRKKSRDGNKILWDFDMDMPMSSYLIAFAIGRFGYERQVTSSGVPMFLFYPSGAVNRVAFTYKYSREIFDYLEREIGYPYPWKVYKQVPVIDFLYAGMENTGATFFSDRYLVDSIACNDRSYININAHELAHQWFGNLVTETEASQHWLHEGFATFYAYLAEAAIMGPQPVYWKLYATARALSRMGEQGKGESLLDPGSGSLTFYEKGAWALFMLKEQIGDTSFNTGVLNFLKKHAYGNATVDDFLIEIEKSSGKSMKEFRHNWLDSKVFPLEEAIGFLRTKSSSIDRFLLIESALDAGDTSGETILENAWNNADLPEYKAEIILQYRKFLSRTILEQAFVYGDLKVQKALMETTVTLEEWMVPLVESYLNADSYELRESSLLRLWIANPSGRANYLDIIAGNGSFTEFRIRQLWWLLAMFTENYEDSGTQSEYLQKLRATTAPLYPSEIRENAFGMLHEIDALGAENIKDLMEATEHHSWQFKIFARRLLEKILESKTESADALKRMAGTFPKEKYGFLHDKIGRL